MGNNEVSFRFPANDNQDEFDVVISENLLALMSAISDDSWVHYAKVIEGDKNE